MKYLSKQTIERIVYATIWVALIVGCQINYKFAVNYAIVAACLTILIPFIILCLHKKIKWVKPCCDGLHVYITKNGIGKLYELRYCPYCGRKIDHKRTEYWIRHGEFN